MHSSISRSSKSWPSKVRCAEMRIKSQKKSLKTNQQGKMAMKLVSSTSSSKERSQSRITWQLACPWSSCSWSVASRVHTMPNASWAWLCRISSTRICYIRTRMSSSCSRWSLSMWSTSLFRAPSSNDHSTKDPLGRSPQPSRRPI